MTEEHKARLRAVFENLGLIKHIPENIFDEISSKFSRVTFEKGDAILRQGRSGGAFFLLIKGKVSVWIENEGENRQISAMEPFTFFGEIALVEGSLRTATLIAEEFVEVYSLGKKDFMEYLYSIEEIRNQVITVAQSRKRQGETGTPSPEGETGEVSEENGPDTQSTAS